MKTADPVILVMLGVATVVVIYATMLVSNIVNLPNRSFLVYLGVSLILLGLCCLIKKTVDYFKEPTETETDKTKKADE